MVIDAPSLACRFCGAINTVPDVYREELRLARDLDEATRRAIAEWARLDRIRVPRWRVGIVAGAPFVLMVGGLGVALALSLLRLVTNATLTLVIAFGIWLPLIPAQAFAARVAMRNILVSGAERVGEAFAAISPTAPGEPPNCRQCGALLSVASDDLLVRCLYCKAESIVQLDQFGIRNLRRRVGSTQLSLAQAMTALKKHARLTALETRGRTYIVAGLLVLPLVWSFAGSIQSSYWCLLIGFAVWLIGICVFWNLRESFLPPVTIEELDALTGLQTSEPAADHVAEKLAVERVASTRGWYDNAFEPVNFVIPGLMALEFVAIELIVLMR